MSGDALGSLGGKLRSLDLDPPEARALAMILLRARDAEPEVEGFAFDVGSLGFDIGATSRQSLTDGDGTLRGDRGFKGTDEELQAIVDDLTRR